MIFFDSNADYLFKGDLIKKNKKENENCLFIHYGADTETATIKKSLRFCWVKKVFRYMNCTPAGTQPCPILKRYYKS